MTDWAQIFTGLLFLMHLMGYTKWEDWSLTITKGVPSLLKPLTIRNNLFPSVKCIKFESLWKKTQDDASRFSVESVYFNPLLVFFEEEERSRMDNVHVHVQTSLSVFYPSTVLFNMIHFVTTMAILNSVPNNIWYVISQFWENFWGKKSLSFYITTLLLEAKRFSKCF